MRRRSVRYGVHGKMYGEGESSTNLVEAIFSNLI